MKTLYFDCFSGISGDMTIGALIDAGGDFNKLKQELKKLNIKEEYKLACKKIIKNGITSTKFDVILSDEHHKHHEHTHNHHHHRSYKEISKLIQSTDLSQRTKKVALSIFKKIGVAEAKVHGVSLEEVHFHEVGAVDSIIDIVGTAILLDQLSIDTIRSSPIPVGSGDIHIEHGVYPVPAPATLEILRGVPIAQSELKAELTTPTGAAIIAELSEDFCTFPAITIQSIGYGAGTKTFSNHPNVLRVIIGE